MMTDEMGWAELGRLLGCGKEGNGQRGPKRKEIGRKLFFFYKNFLLGFQTILQI
jgi:hypothetical protein